MRKDLSELYWEAHGYEGLDIERFLADVQAGTWGAYTADEIRDFCKGQIAHYKVPRYIRFVTSFPMTVTGKIQKFKIRDEMKDLLGLEEQKTA